MQIQAFSSSLKSNLSTSTAAPALPEMDASAFMMVLLAQMRHQNPLEPMDDKEMIAQMTQLNSLQELQRIRLTLQTLVQVVQQENPAAEVA
jgi:flagellar basal-body rod modification protein FlgD